MILKAKFKYSDPKNPLNDFTQFTEVEFELDETYWRNEFAKATLSGMISSRNFQALKVAEAPEGFFQFRQS